MGTNVVTESSLVTSSDDAMLKLLSPADACEPFLLPELKRANSVQTVRKG